MRRSKRKTASTSKKVALGGGRRAKKKTKKSQKKTKKSQKREVKEAEEEEVEKPTALEEAFRRRPLGVIMTFGSGDMAQLGHGEEIKYRELKYPLVIQSLADKKIVSVCSGSLHQAALTSDGEVYTWGVNDDNALGREGDEWVPKKVGGFLKGEIVVKIGCGASHTLCLTNKGVLFSWGTYRDPGGVIGYSEHMRTAKVPVEVELPKKALAKDIAVGDEVDIALTDSGAVYQWGDIGQGQRSSGRLKLTKLTPRQVRFSGRKARPFQAVLCGGYTCMALEKDDSPSNTGRLWVWGPNNYTQCGLENPSEEQLFVQVPTVLPGLQHVKTAAAQIHHTMILTQEGKLYTCGRGAGGRLGHGDEKDCATPKEVEFFSNREDKPSVIALGEAHSLVGTAAGELFTWGDGELLQLGNGKEEGTDVPLRVSSKHLNKEFLRPVVSVSAGAQHSTLFCEPDPVDVASGGKKGPKARIPRPKVPEGKSALAPEPEPKSTPAAQKVAAFHSTPLPPDSDSEEEESAGFAVPTPLPETTPTPKSTPVAPIVPQVSVSATPGPRTPIASPSTVASTKKAFHNTPLPDEDDDDDF